MGLTPDSLPHYLSVVIVGIKGTGAFQGLHRGLLHCNYSVIAGQYFYCY